MKDGTVAQSLVATNQKVNKTFKSLTYSLLPVPCFIKSSRIVATNTHRIAIYFSGLFGIFYILINFGDRLA